MPRLNLSYPRAVTSESKVGPTSCACGKPVVMARFGGNGLVALERAPRVISIATTGDLFVYASDGLFIDHACMKGTEQ